MIGDSGVGKTALLNRYANNSFSHTFVATIGIDLKHKLVSIQDEKGLLHKVRLTIWDTAGQEKFRTITKQYLRGADGVVLVYDVSHRASFENMASWITLLDQNLPITSIPMVVAANKCDFPNPKVSEEEGSLLALEYGCSFFSTSAFANVNVENTFMRLAEEILRRKLIEQLYFHHQLSEKVTIVKSSEEEKTPTTCCGTTMLSVSTWE